MAAGDDNSAFELWIRDNLAPTRSSVALGPSEAEGVSGVARSSGVEIPLTHEYPGHWRDNGVVWDFVWSLIGAKRILDIGTTDGWPGLRLAKYFPSVVGIDADNGSVRRAQGNAYNMRTENVRFCVMDPKNMAFADGSFDGVATSGAFERTGDAAAAAREAFRVLKPGGMLRVYYQTGQTEGSEQELVSISRDTDGEVHYTYVHRAGRRGEDAGPFSREYHVRIDPARLDDRRLLGKACARTSEGRFVELTNAPELGVPLLEDVLLGVTTAGWFEVRYLSASDMIKVLSDAGFENVRTTYPGSEVAYRIYRSLSLVRLPDQLKRDFEPICRAAGRLATELDAPMTYNGPVTARKPLDGEL